MAEILFVVHRAYPFPGGSEYYTHDMAKEMKNRGHNITVLAHEHQGDQDGITMSSDYNILVNNKWDLIVVHGCDCVSQNVTLMNAAIIKSPICYMIIKPSNSDIALHGMKYAKYLAYSTTMDLEHIKNFGDKNKARRIRHGIVVENTIGVLEPPNPRNPYFVSAGGFYPHKGMPALANAFSLYGNKTDELHLFGYADGEKPNSAPDEEPLIRSWLGLPKNDVMSAIRNSKGYILNSYEEGFGLVLLEAMLNKVPVYARNIAGAKDMGNHVMTYNSEKELFKRIEEYESNTPKQKALILEDNYNYAMSNHTIVQTGDDIEDILMEEMR